MNISLPQVPVFTDRIEKKFQLAVMETEVAGISADDLNPDCEICNLAIIPDDILFARFLTELFPRDHLSQSPTTWRVA